MLIQNKLFVVLVIYKQKLSESDSYITLMSLLKSQSLAHVLIYDNSPKSFMQETIPDKIDYIRDFDNSGLAVAYNCALKKALAQGCFWLLLLDQDSQVKKTLFEEFYLEKANFENIAIVVPQIYNHDGRSISPLSWDKHKKVKCGFHKQLHCINSLSIINIEFAIDVMKGFDENFPLDMLDYSTCNFVNKSKYGYWVLSCKMEHSLSVLSDGYVSVERYKSILLSEVRFFKMTKKFKTYLVRLILRTFKFILFKRYNHAWINIKYLLSLL
ncbi:glycosyltransferase [Segatella copri]|uniref:glycosyltransferase n=1 Tax=Segatella copri TaxID=165179 RepID=UPI003D080EC5